MARIFLLIAALLLPLAGCLGLPEGSVANGDTATVSVTVYDLHTGEQLAQNGRLNFVVGSGVGGFGFEFERALQGLQPGASRTLEIRNDPSLQWGPTVAVDSVFEDDLLGTIETAQFQQFFGEPVPGNEFQPEFSFYLFRVEAVEDGMVTYRVLPEDGQVDNVAHLGANLITTVDESRGVMIQSLVAIEGATFQIQPPSPFNPSTPLGLSPGAYRAIGNDNQQIVYQFSASGNPAIIGKDLRIEVTVLSVVPGEALAVEPVDGNYGVRASPVINGVPSSQVDYTAPPAHTH